MRRFLLLVTASAILVACAEDPAPIAPAASREPTVDPIDEARPEIYESLTRELLEVEKLEWDEIVVLTELCEAAAEPAAPAVCEAPLSPAEQEDLAARLDDLDTPVSFVDDLGEDVFSERVHTIVVMLGPIDETEAGVEVGGGYICGGLCGSGTTYLLEDSDDGWEVTGTTGPMWIA